MVRYPDLGNGLIIITSSAEKAENNATVRGVVILVSLRVYGQLPVVDGQPITRAFNALPTKTDDFAMMGLREAIKSTQANKATGLDGFQQRYGSLNVSMIIY